MAWGKKELSNRTKTSSGWGKETEVAGSSKKTVCQAEKKKKKKVLTVQEPLRTEWGGKRKGYNS